MTHQQDERDNASWRATTPARDHFPMTFGSLMVVVLLLGVALVAWAVQRNRAIYAEFMSGCEQDHKHYECMLLWRASDHERDGPLVQGGPIPDHGAE